MNNFTAHYRGIIQGLITQQHHAIFATRHSEGQLGSLYRLDLEKEVPSLGEAVLPCGVTALTQDGKNLYIAGDNGQLYKAEIIKGKPKAVTVCQWNEEDLVHGLAILADSQLAMLHSKQLVIQSLGTTTSEQSFSFEDETSCIASSPDGLWLAVGDSKGHVHVYEQHENVWQLSNQAKIHKGKVSSIQFEKNELRFYSAGEDKKLFSTHAQGALEPLDKGRNSNHEGVIQSISLGHERFFTAADDKTIKAWPFAGGQPVTLKEGVKKTKFIAQIEHMGKPHLLLSGQNQNFTLVSLTPDDKFSEIRAIIRDGYAWARDRLSLNQASERDQGIALLTQYDDKKSLDLLNKHFKNEQSKDTRLAITSAFAQSKHHYANTLLLEMLDDNKHPEIRLSALAALQKRLNKNDLQAYEKALSTAHTDVGLAAMQALLPLAKKDHRAENILIEALQHQQADVAKHALDLLEKHYDKQSARASLLALKSEHTSVARAALVRLYQRKLLDQFDVKRTLLLAQNHDNEQLRQTALLVSVLGQAKLAKALKTRDQRLARSLLEIEDFDLLAPVAEKSDDATKKKEPEAPKPSSLKSLDSDDYRVLLQGMSNSYADVSFTAAFALATLQDQRAFGLLVLLSREKNASIRIGVCQAFAWLNQAESTEQLRLLLNDRKPSVRDMAFSALLQTNDNSLDVAEYGLASEHQDVHDRSLKTILDSFTASKSKEVNPQALALLTQTLNDPFEPVRQEALKAAFNRKLGGDDESTLQLLLTSHHESLHIGVLNELKTKSEVLPVVEWVQPALFALLDDDHQRVRIATFEFIASKKKRFDLQTALSEAVTSSYLDVRKAAHTYLTKHPSKAHQAHLQVMITDENHDLRIQALQALVLSANEEAVAVALASEYDDVKVNAAVALASWGNEQAFQPLMDFLARPKPTEKALVEQWAYTIEQALSGVSRLGDSRAYDTVFSFLSHDKSHFVTTAAQALPWVTQNAKPKVKAQLATLLNDERPAVQNHACLALALLSDEQANTVLTKVEGSKGLDAYQLMAAKAALNDITPVSLQTLLENGNTQLSALTTLFAHEFLLHSDSPFLSTWALSLDGADVQLISAKLLSQYHDADARLEVLRGFIVNSLVSSGAKSWNISTESLMDICHVLVHGDGHSKARTTELLRLLDHRTPLKQWSLHIEQWTLQHQELITKLRSTKTKAPNVKQKLVWQQRAFGAYLGLIRQEPEYGSNMQLRALNALSTLAEKTPELSESAESCLLTLLNSDDYTLRHKAFEKLQALGTDVERLGYAATTSPQADIAKQGLVLLTQHYPVKKSKSLLEEMICSDDETLSEEAYQLYLEDQGLLAVSGFALESQNIDLRTQVIDALAVEFDDKKVQKVLLDACNNSQPSVAMRAMQYLAKHQHPDAFTVISQRLTDETNTQYQSVLIVALQQIKTPNVAVFLVDYLLNNPLCQFSDGKLLEIIGNYRNRETFATLLTHLKKDNKKSFAIIKSLFVITGFDQPIQDIEEQSNDRRWLEKLHPYHEDLLLQLFQTLLDLKLHKEAVELSLGLAWMQDKKADQALSDAANVIQKDYLHLIIGALNYRVKRREGSPESLVRLLEHKESDIQFLAAEVLALNGHGQGFNVLFAAVDYQEEDSLRQRAVLALGHLADERSLEKILKLAEDKEHYLHDAAIEAIGHMGDGEHSEKIFKLITNAFEQADSFGNAAKHAIRGLRYLNTLKAWQYLLKHIGDSDGRWATREFALLELKHWDTDASRACVLKQLREDDDCEVAKAAYTTARHYWPLDKQIIDEVDIALVQGENAYLDEDLFERLGKYATTEQLLQLLSADYAGNDYSVQQTLSVLAQALQQHDDLSDKALIEALEAKRTSVVSIACRLLNRQPKLSKALNTSLSKRTEEYLVRWQKDYQLAQQDQYSYQNRLQETQSCLLALLSTQVVHDVYGETLLGLLVSEEKTQRVFQEKILSGLSAKDTIKDKSLLSALETLQQSTLASVRATADQLLAQHTKNADKLSWESFLSQPQVLLSSQFSADLQDAAATQAHQAQVLPTLIQQQDSDTLHKIACDETVKESVRVGAIEGLACILTDKANKALSDLHKTTKDKDIAKQAYRALRRQQRNLAKQNAANQTAGA